MAKSESAAMAGMPGCEMAASCTDCGPQADSGKNDKNDKNDRGDKGMKPGCMLMAGCAVVMALKEPAAASAVSRATQTSHYWPIAANLSGREVVPEPEPPTLLG